MGNYNNVVMLASSGSKEEGKGGVGRQLKRLPNDMSPNFTQKSPLEGVNMDVLHLQEIQQLKKKERLQYFEQHKNKQDPNYKFIEATTTFNAIIIQSSTYKGKLLKRKEITSKLAQAFRAGHNTFIFTGHGMYKGAMVMQTQESKDGQPFRIQELVQIFIDNNLHKKKLQIFLDCCYAGKMAFHLKQSKLPKDFKVQVFCSSGPSDTSSDLNNYGGLLVCWFWAKETKNKYLLKVHELFLAGIFQQKNPFKIFKTNRKRQSRRGMLYNWLQQTDQKGWTTMEPLKWDSSRQTYCQLI